MKQILLSLLLTLSVGGVSYAAHHEDSEASSKHDEKDVKHAHKKGKKHKHMKRKHHARWARTDANEDGQVDLNEYLAAAEERFNKMDLNSDGVVTKKEMKEGHHKMRSEHKKAMKAARKAHREEADN